MLSKYGQSLVFNGSLDQGLSILNKAMELNPLNEAIIDTLVWANYAAEKFEKCIEFQPLSKHFSPHTWIIRIACLGALSREQERNEEFEAFIDFHGREEMNKQLAHLKFNNTEIENNIRLLVNNDRESLIQSNGSKIGDAVSERIN